MMDEDVAGDKIKSMNVSFEGILLEDATAILSYAAPYKVPQRFFVVYMEFLLLLLEESDSQDFEIFEIFWNFSCNFRGT